MAADPLYILSILSSLPNPPPAPAPAPMPPCPLSPQENSRPSEHQRNTKRASKEGRASPGEILVSKGGLLGPSAVLDVCALYGRSNPGPVATLLRHLGSMEDGAAKAVLAEGLGDAGVVIGQALGEVHAKVLPSLSSCGDSQPAVLRRVSCLLSLPCPFPPRPADPGRSKELAQGPPSRAGFSLVSDWPAARSIPPMTVDEREACHPPKDSSAASCAARHTPG